MDLQTHVSQVGATLATSHMSDVVLAALIGAVGVVFTAVVTVTGVLLANWNSRKQLRMQLDASAQEAARARLFEMRRTVYLDGVEAIARANSMLARMADIDLPNAEITLVTLEAIPRLAKVQAVATPETVQAASDYLSAFSECQVALWPHRWELLGRASLITTLEQQAATWIADRDRWMEQIKQANVEGAATARPEIYKNLWFQYNNAESFRGKIQTDLTALRQVQTHEQLELLELCLDQTVPMLRVLPAMLARARAELEIPGDEATLLGIMSEASQRQASTARALAAKARELAGQTPPAAAKESSSSPTRRLEGFGTVVRRVRTYGYGSGVASIVGI